VKLQKIVSIFHMCHQKAQSSLLRRIIWFNIILFIPILLLVYEGAFRGKSLSL
jgi:hypothetical protein